MRKKGLILGLMLCGLLGLSQTVSPLFPANGSVEPTSFIWTIKTYSGGQYYDVQVDTVPTFNSGAIRTYVGSTDYSGLPDGAAISDTIKNLFYGKKYYWRARMRNASGDHPWTTNEKTFTTVDAPSFDAPADQSFVNPNGFNIYSTFDLGNKDYWIEGSQDPTFTYPIYYRELNQIALLNPNMAHGTQFTMFVSGFPSTGDYYFRIMAKNDVDSSEWSIVKMFTMKEEKNGPLSVKDYVPGSFSVYPNPAHNTIIIVSKNELKDVSIFDISGKLVHVEEINANQKIIDVSTLKKGIYFVRSVDINGELKLEKVQILR